MISDSFSSQFGVQENPRAREFNDGDRVKAFLLDEFCNQRKRLHLKTAAFWKLLITEFLAADEPAKYVAPVTGWNFDAYAYLILAAGGYCHLERVPITKRVAAEAFGLPKNAAKQHLHRIRRRSEQFFARGGEYVPAEREPEARKKRPTNPLRYSLDSPVFTGHRQWRTPTYKLAQRSPELSSIITVSGRQTDEGVRTDTEVNVLDESIQYDYSKLKGHIARLPCPSPAFGGRWEYPDFDDEFWSFTRDYEAHYAYRAALQSCLAEMAGKKYADLCATNKRHNPAQLEGRAVLQTGDDQRTTVGARPTLVDRRIINENFGAKEDTEPTQRGLTIKLSGRGLQWKIEHSKLGSGFVLKVNGDVVCCNFNSGRANLTVGSIKRKTGIDLKKKFALHEAMRRISAVQNAKPVSVNPQLIRTDANQGIYAP